MVAITKPTVNGSSGTWGTILNQALDDIVTGVNAAVPASTVTAKGDLLVATASGTVARQAVGSNGQILVADSTQTNGLKWAPITVTGYNGVGNFPLPATAGVGTTVFDTATSTYWRVYTYGGTAYWGPEPGTQVLNVYQSTAQTALTSGTYFALSLQTAHTGGNPFAAWSSSTNNSRFTAPWPGLYEFTGGVSWGSAAAGYRACAWRKNGTAPYATASLARIYISGTVGTNMAARTWMQPLANGDYVELVHMQQSGDNTITTDIAAGLQSNMTVTYHGTTGLQ